MNTKKKFKNLQLFKGMLLSMKKILVELLIVVLGMIWKMKDLVGEKLSILNIQVILHLTVMDLY